MVCCKLLYMQSCVAWWNGSDIVIAEYWTSGMAVSYGIHGLPSATMNVAVTSLKVRLWNWLILYVM